MGCLRYACFVGDMCDGNNGWTMACRNTAQLRRLYDVCIAGDSRIQGSQERTFTTVCRIAC